ncbi:MAG TPA: helix-turn-helix domain-containing protein, partial [Vicinamibacterales bacterium]
MPRTRAEHPPRQARSRETLRRMLDAAEIVLVKYGAEGATLPRIARQARLSPASVYRRFRDKDALMRAVFRRFNERSEGAVDEGFRPESVRPIGLRQFSRNVVRGMVAGFRSNAALSRAAIQYAERHPDADFVKKSAESEARSFQRMVETFLIWRDEIRRPDPEQAIRFGFLVVACVLRDLILFERMRVMSRVSPVD